MPDGVTSDCLPVKDSPWLMLSKGNASQQSWFFLLVSLLQSNRTLGLTCAPVCASAHAIWGKRLSSSFLISLFLQTPPPMPSPMQSLFYLLLGRNFCLHLSSMALASSLIVISVTLVCVVVLCICPFPPLDSKPREVRI